MRPWQRSVSGGLEPGPLSMLSGMLNEIIALDAEHQRILSALEGKRFRIVMDRPTSLAVDLAVRAGRIQVTEVGGPAADVELRGSGPALVSLLRSGGNAIPGGKGVSVSGDVAALRVFQQVLHQLQPDWEEPLARLLGDRLAHPLALGVSSLARLAVDTLTEFKDMSSEYLREESGLLVRAQQMQDFTAEVEATRDQVDRLQKRFERMQRELPEDP